LGIDPGLAIVGYSVVEKKGNRFILIDYGVIRTPAEKKNVDRLNMIYTELCILINNYQPDDMAVEELFVNKVAEYTPLQVKQAVVGYGNASKTQVQQMVRALLNLEEIPRPDWK